MTLVGRRAMASPGGRKRGYRAASRWSLRNAPAGAAARPLQCLPLLSCIRCVGEGEGGGYCFLWLVSAAVQVWWAGESARGGGYRWKDRTLV